MPGATSHRACEAMLARPSRRSAQRPIRSTLAPRSRILQPRALDRPRAWRPEVARATFARAPRPLLLPQRARARERALRCFPPTSPRARSPDARSKAPAKTGLLARNPRSRATRRTPTRHAAGAGTMRSGREKSCDVRVASPCRDPRSAATVLATSVLAKRRRTSTARESSSITPFARRSSPVGASRWNTDGNSPPIPLQRGETIGFKPGTPRNLGARDSRRLK